MPSSTVPITASNGVPCDDFPFGRLCMAITCLWVRLGVWEQINAELVEQVRIAAGREAHPSLVIIDSQSVRIGVKGEETGFDGTRR